MKQLRRQSTHVDVKREEGDELGDAQTLLMLSIKQVTRENILWLRDLCSRLWADRNLCIASSLCCAVETNATLESSYTPTVIHCKKKCSKMALYMSSGCRIYRLKSH